MTGLVLIQMVLALALVWSCFCRLVRTSGATVFYVRWAIVAKSATALWVATAPILPLLNPHDFDWAPGTTPIWVWVSFLLAVVAFHLAFARMWAPGTATLEAIRRSGMVHETPAH